MDEVLKNALVRVPEPIEWDESVVPDARRVAGDDAAAAQIAH
jgi:ATP-dependent Lon protease